jgi:hypothetical protein
MGLAVGGMAVATVADAPELDEHDESIKAASMPTSSLFIDFTGEIIYRKYRPTRT